MKYVTKQILQRIRGYETPEFQFNQALSDDFVEHLEPTVKLPVVYFFSHQPEVIRCRVVCDADGKCGLVDMPIDEFVTLPDEVSEDEKKASRAKRVETIRDGQRYLLPAGTGC